MIKRSVRDIDSNSRYVGLEELSKYTSLSKYQADKMAQEAGAKKKYGKRSLYDLRAIDKYFEEQE